MSPDQSHGMFTVRVACQRCANGETYEFWLELDGVRVNDPGVLRTVVTGDYMPAHASAALKELLKL